LASKGGQRLPGAFRSTKSAFRAAPSAVWENPFYQYVNRLSHLYFLRKINRVDAYLLFVYFADAPDVPHPCTVQQWEGADRLVKAPYIGTLIWRVPDMEPRAEHDA